LDRVIDLAGQPLKCRFSASRDAQAAQRFVVNILDASNTIPPRVITVDKNAASPQAFRKWKASEAVSADGE
jgi:transposase, IS6 family